MPILGVVEVGSLTPGMWACAGAKASMRALTALALTYLAACTLGGNVTSTLSQVGDPAEQTAIVSHPMYRKFDAYSFSLAHLTYPAQGGSHDIPVGNYLLRRTMDAFTGKAVDLVRLTSFKSDCRAIGFYSPQATCDTQLTIAYNKQGSEKQLEINRSQAVGNFHHKLPLDPSDRPIVEQARRVMDDVIEKIKQEAKSI